MNLSQTELVLDLITQEGWKAELTLALVKNHRQLPIEVVTI